MLKTSIIVNRPPTLQLPSNMITLVSEQLNQIEIMKTKLQNILNRSNVVGVLASEADLRIALRTPRIADIYEWRVDRFPGPTAEQGIGKLHKLGRPIILTVRDSLEGGTDHGWSNVGRAHWYQQYLHRATLIDIEASTVSDPALTAVVTRAKEEGVGVIISRHILAETWRPSLAIDAYRMCNCVGGDICKLALHPDSFDDVCGFLGCLPVLGFRGSDVKIAPMIIGDKFGKVSRLLFGISGVPLIYGYLSNACVAGQWKVSKIKPMLKKMK